MAGPSATSIALQTTAGSIDQRHCRGCRWLSPYARVTLSIHRDREVAALHLHIEPKVEGRQPLAPRPR